jgi:hypothetical protein
MNSLEIQAYAALLDMRIQFEVDNSMLVGHRLHTHTICIAPGCPPEEVDDDVIKAWLMYLAKLFRSGNLPGSFLLPTNYDVKTGVQVTNA